MKHLRASYVGILCALSILAVGCANKSPAALSNYSEGALNGAAPSEVSGEAKLNREQSKELLTVNTVYIPQPILSRSSTGGDPRHLRKIIADSFLAESSMTIVPEKTVSAGHAICEGARLAGADACLVVSIDSYRERAGSSMAATILSEVSYTLELVRVSDKKLLFQKSFGFRDQSITEDLFRAEDTMEQKGGSSGYATASSVFSRSLRLAFRELDSLRTKQFLG
jgi:hypothetical protein